MIRKSCPAALLIRGRRRTSLLLGGPGEPGPPFFCAPAPGWAGRRLLYTADANHERIRVAKKSAVAERLESVRARIAAAAARAKRDPGGVTLIAVTKTATPEAIREAVSLGVTDLGEGRVQQLVQRASQMNEVSNRRKVHGDGETQPKPPVWHMIGSLQRNKVKPLLPLVACIHSIDSLRLAEEIDAAAVKLGRKVNVMLQLNASEEPQKHGIAIGAATHLGEAIASMPNLQLVGLMTMAELTDEEKAVRAAFRRTREVFEEMKWHKTGGQAFRHLSMGMSHDFELAVEEGSTMVRVGSAIFGEATQDEDNDE